MRINICAIALMLVSSACGAMEHSSSVAPRLNLSEKQALAVANRVALRQGKHLDAYQLTPSGQRLSPDASRWRFVFLCRPQPAHPGCGFVAIVDRASGNTQITPVK